MAEVINMPRLSDTMEEGVVAKWLKKEGDKVSEGDILAEIETDKATMEFESFYEGTLLHIGIKEGETAPVDALLAIIGEKGEDISGLLNGKKTEDGSPKSEAESSEKKESRDAKSSVSTEDKKEERGESKETDDGSRETDAEKNNDSQEKGKKEEENSRLHGNKVPEGVEIINMPRLSDTMEEGTIAKWLKKEGDKVSEGDILAEIETDKATMEFESFYEGTLLKIGIQEGESAPVDSLLAIIGPEGTDVSGVGEGKKEERKETEDGRQKTEEEENRDAKSSVSTDEKDSAPKNVGNGNRIFVSPLAKKMAEEKGIDLSDVKGSGENGRIVKKDIENYQPSAKPQAEKAEKNEEKTAAQPYTPAGEESFEEINNSQMRKTIAKRLAESKFNAPHYYLTIEIDMETAMKSRKDINELPDIKISFNDMVIKASAMALQKHPRVNSQWSSDKTKIAKHIHIGFAVAVEDGLVVPVLPFADQMSLTQIGNNVKDLAVKARNKKLQPKEMEGSTFTVSNLGMFGIVEFTSIINQPNSAILSVGAIVEKPVVKNGQIQVGHTMKVTLACDHRTVDGATGSKFLETLKMYLENPVTMLA
ncbi:MAG TPA: pyruvate dehydrogenase complex dihydrolipoamide acetyltransferase [Flavobacteriaceae bacterium]|nr:pyruvate dehydrogenase complex dihydrolipoamide acetyltransferase [Flavobacteriaceae bacterium]